MELIGEKFKLSLIKTPEISIIESGESSDEDSRGFSRQDKKNL